MRSYVAAKLHGIAVTAASVTYNGSVTIGADLMDAVGIDPYEQVDVVNLSTGGRWTTYALPGAPGVFSLNGGGARLGVVGDRCVVMTYRLDEEFAGAPVAFCDEANRIVRTITYPGADPDLAGDVQAGGSR